MHDCDAGGVGRETGRLIPSINRLGEDRRLPSAFGAFPAAQRQRVDWAASAAGAHGFCCAGQQLRVDGGEVMGRDSLSAAPRGDGCGVCDAGKRQVHALNAGSSTSGLGATPDNIGAKQRRKAAHKSESS